MGLAVRKNGNGYLAVLTCDTCGQPIKNVLDAIPVIAPPSKGLTSEVHIYHKGECNLQEGIQISLVKHLFGVIRLFLRASTAPVKTVEKNVDKLIDNTMQY